MQTITLHNIRYELVWRGEELWKVGAGADELVGTIARSEDGDRWEGWMGERLVMAFPNEGAVRTGLRQYVNILLKRG